VSFSSLVPYGWSDRWADRLAAFPAPSRPARILRHDGVGLVVATDDGVETVMLARRLDPEPVVGDWVVLEGAHPIAVLPRDSLLRRRSANTDTEQALVANVDMVLLVCGVDRPIKIGRIQRGAALARDAGSEPVIVLTKAALADDIDAIVDEVATANPGLTVIVTSVKEGTGVETLTSLAEGRTVTLLGESGAGKSSIVNALLDADAAEVGRVRDGDSKGRHTTTTRQLHVLPNGGVLIDTPGIRSVGLWVDPDAVTETFADIDELADGCRFVDCAHQSEPGCLITEAIAEGTITVERLEAWRTLRREAELLALKAEPPKRTGRPPRDEPPPAGAPRRKRR
jgi:ribosome biogenesis GTPase